MLVNLNKWKSDQYVSNFDQYVCKFEQYVPNFEIILLRTKV